MTVIVDDSNFKNIAQAIREKNGTEATYKPNEMAEAIRSIETGNSESDALLTQLISSRSSITDIAFPVGITKIDNNAFSGCNKLAVTELPATITYIGNYAFQYCYKLPLTSLPSGITYIGQYAFANCSILAITELPEGITEINTNSFSSCKALTTITIPAAVQYVWTSAFSLCSALTSVTFNGTPTEIASNAFNYCNALTTINVPWAEGAVAGAPWGATNATINYNYEPPIKFTIDGVEYYSEPNTNWYNWAGSEYNPDGRFIRYNDGTYYRVKDGQQEGTPDIYHNGSRVIANSIILADTAYYTEGNEP